MNDHAGKASGGLASNRDELCLLLILAGVAVLVSTALFYEHVQGLAPCPLCLTQRLSFILVGLIAWIALADRPERLIYPALIVAVSALGGYFSIRQLYLQHLPPDQVPACGPSLDYMIDVFPFHDVLKAMLAGTGDCALVNWSLFGLSMAGWALIGFIGLAVVALFQLWQGLRHRI